MAPNGFGCLRDVLRLVCFASRCNWFSRSRSPSRLRADTTSKPAAAAAAAAVPGLDSIKGSAEAPEASSGSTKPKPSVVEASSSIMLTVSLPVTLSALTPWTLMGFRCVTWRYCRTYVNSESTGTLAAPSVSTVVLPVHGASSSVVVCLAF